MLGEYNFARKKSPLHLKDIIVQVAVSTFFALESHRVRRHGCNRRRAAAAASSSKSAEGTVGQTIALWEVPDSTIKTVAMLRLNLKPLPILVICHWSIFCRHNIHSLVRNHAQQRLEHHFFLTQLCASHPYEFPLGSSSKDQSTLGLVALKIHLLTASSYCGWLRNPAP